MEDVIASDTLPSLLWIALDGLERASVDEGAGCDRMPSLEQWANLLRILDHRGVHYRELRALLRLSKRAVRSRQSSAIRNGWVEELKSDRDQATVRLTVFGFDVAARWKLLQDSAEDRWREKVGADR